MDDNRYCHFENFFSAHVTILEKMCHGMQNMDFLQETESCKLIVGPLVEIKPVEEIARWCGHGLNPRLNIPVKPRNLWQINHEAS